MTLIQDKTKQELYDAGVEVRKHLNTIETLNRKVGMLEQRIKFVLDTIGLDHRAIQETADKIMRELLSGRNEHDQK